MLFYSVKMVEVSDVEDTPLFWFLAGVGTATWWLKNPNSKLFWFVAGAGAATWFAQSPALGKLREKRKKHAEYTIKKLEEMKKVREFPCHVQTF